MRKLAASLLSLALCAGLASAGIGENMVQGVYDFAVNLFFSNIKGTLKLIASNMAAKPAMREWPIMSSIHDGFGWLAGFFVLAMIYQGIRYTVSAESPSGRAGAKLAVQRMIVGMVFISANGFIFETGLDVSAALTNAFVGPVDVQEPALAKFMMLSTVELACLIAPLGLGCVLLLLIMYLARYMALLLVWAFFPIILALYFSQVGYLSRLGSRGLSVYLSAIFAAPVMGFLFKISYDLLIAATASMESAKGLVNGFEPFVALFMSLAGFLLAGLSPLFTLGLFDKAGSVISVAGAVVGAATGGAFGAAAGGLVSSSASGLKDAAGDIAAQNQPNLKNDIKSAGEKADEELRRRAVKVASSQDFDATDEGRIKFMMAALGEYNSFKADGIVHEDDEGRIQVGDAGKELDREKGGLIRNYREWTAPYGRGYGDRASREIAQERGLMSDGRLIMKNAAVGAHDMGGRHYEIAVNDGGDGLYNVAVQGQESMTVLTVAKSGGLATREKVVEEIIGQSASANLGPERVLKRMHERARPG